MRINDNYTEYFSLQKSVRQGCPLTSTLFNIYINDFFDEINGIYVDGISYKVHGLHFADDTVIFTQSIDEIQPTIKKIEKWCKQNAMEINVQKSGLMMFNDNTNKNLSFNLFNSSLPIVNEYVYLGIKINENLNLKKCYRIMKKKQETL